MKLNRFILVSIILLAIISFGAVSAASDATADDSAVGVTEGLDLAASDVSEISAGGDDIALSSNDGDVLSAGSVAPNYTIEVTPNVMDAGKNYVAQYGQVITVNGTIENATGNVSIRFGYSGNYHNYVVPLVDGKFTKDLTDYDRVRNNYNIQVTWPGDDTYKSISWSKNIHVQMENVTANGAYYGLPAFMDIDLFDATGNVTCIVNDEVNYTGTLENGKLYVEIRNYTVGKNYVDLIYNGDERFNPIERSFSFTVEPNIRAPTIYNYEKAVVEIFFGEATGNATIALGNETHELNIVGGKVSTEIENYAVGDNTLEITYSGDATFNPFEITYVLTVLDKEDATIVSSVYKTASQNFIFINIPHATGSINVTVNGKKEVWDLENGTVKKDIAASDVITELIVSYAGNVRLNPTTSSKYVNLTDYIVNSETFFNYFDPANGRLYDFLEEGITLDFQGVVYVNTNSENEFDIIISKPINIISSTGDAYIDLNTTAGSLLGEHPGSSFVVGPEGSGSNISGIYLHNTELWISNTTNVVFDNIAVVVEDQRVGSGVGATSVRDNSSYVTLKNSYFYTRNNGGSTTFTFSWANHCVFDNNTVKVEGNVGNMLYLNVYNIKNLPGPTKTSWGDVLPDYPLNNYNVFSNNRLYGKEGSAISVGIMVEGSHNVIANNTLNKTSISTSFGGTGANSNVYYGNVLMQGSSLTAQASSIVYDNYVPGTLATGSNSVAYNNTAGKMTVTAGSIAYQNDVEQTMTVAAGSSAHDNTIGTTLTVSGANAFAFKNTADAITVSGADSTVSDNIIAGAATISGANVFFTGNVIGTSANVLALSASASGASGAGTGSLKVTGKNDVVYDNTIFGPVTISGANTTFDENDVTDLVTVSSNANTITNNRIVTDGDYAIDLTTSSQNTVEYNRLVAGDSKGDDAVKSDAASDNDIERNMGKQIMTITVSDIWYGENNTIVVIVPEATGNITVKVNKKEYAEIPLVNGNAIVKVAASDIASGLNDVTVTYNGDASIAADSDYASFMAYDDTVTPETFFAYFDDTGFLRSTVPFDELSFRGTFEDLVDYVIINKPLYLDGYKAKFINMGIVISSSDVTIEDLEMEADKSLGNLITVSEDNVQLLYLDIEYVVGDEEACAIAVLSSDNVVIRSCDIYFESNITSDDKETYAINIYDSENVLMRYNDITARLPGLYMSEYDWSYFAMGLAYVNPVRIYESVNVNFTSNDLDVGFSNIVATSFPDLQAMIVAGSENVLIDGNDISITDTFLKPGQSMGIVGIQFIGNDNVVLTKNEITISTQAGVVSGGGTAYPMTIIGTSIDIFNNKLVTEDNGPNLGVYMPMGFAAGKVVNIINNKITVTGNVTAKNSNWALISGVEVQAGTANIYGNEITVVNKAGYNESYCVAGVSMYQDGYKTVVFDVQNNTITTNSLYTVYIPNGKVANVTGNILYAQDLFGDASVKSTISGVVELNMPPFEPEIIVTAGGWSGLDGVITVTIPEATGNVTIKVGSKTFKDLELVNGTVTQIVNASDLVFGANQVNVTYTGDLYHFAGEVTANLQVVDGVITNETFYQYFDKNTNYLYDFIPEGVTLDFQGSFVGAQYSIYVNKGVNIISSTGDALFDSGANPNRNWIKLNIVEGANHTNITGIHVLNGDLFVQGASYITIDNVSMIAKMSGVGSGTGFLAIHSNAYYTTVKNSFFQNGGTGSSILVLGNGGKYATFDNNEFLITGSSGNILSSNVYVGKGERPQCVNYTNNLVNYTLASGSAFTYGITVCGEGNLIENNTLYFKGNGIITQYGANAGGSIYRNNKLYGSCSMSVGDNSLVENNYVEGGALTIAPGCEAYNNTAKTMTISGANSVVSGSTVGAVTISGKNVTFLYNDVIGLVTVSSSGNTIQFNNIRSFSDYAVDLKSTSDNTVTDNRLISDMFYGDEAVNYNIANNNVVENNTPVDPELEVTVESVPLDEPVVIKISVKEDITDDYVIVVLDGRTESVPILNGKAEYSVLGLDAGHYAVGVTYVGDYVKYGSDTTYVDFQVYRLEPQMTLNMTVDYVNQDVVVTVTVTDPSGMLNATGMVDVIVDGVENVIDLENGTVTYKIHDPSVGNHSVVAVYGGNEILLPDIATATFEIKSIMPAMTLDISEPILGQDVVVTVTVTDESGMYNATGIVAIVVDGIENYMELENGIATYTIKAPQAGLHSVVAIYSGDDDFYADEEATSFTLVDYATEFTNITIDNNVITAYLVDETGAAVANAAVKYTVNGVEFRATTAADGSIIISDVADSTVVLEFEGATPLLASNVSINLKNIPPLRTSTELFADDFTQYSCDYAAGERGGFFKVQLKDANGKPLVNKTIAVGFNGVVGYYQTDANGWIEKQIALQNAGEYTFASIFLGDDDYTASFIVNKITIVKKPTSISASAKSYKASASKKSYSVALKTIAGSSIDGKVYLSAGKKITFTVNGKTYTAKTDASGKATVNLKLTKKGTYTIKVSFAGDGAYAASSTSQKITIK